MKMAPIMKPTLRGSSPPHWAARYVASSVKENLKTLSFIAPRNCVQKNGAKRRSPSNSNCDACPPSRRAVPRCTEEGDEGRDGLSAITLDRQIEDQAPTMRHRTVTTDGENRRHQQTALTDCINRHKKSARSRARLRLKLCPPVRFTDALRICP